MQGIAGIERVLWGFSFLLNVALLFLILYWKNYRVYRFFSIYVVLAILQSIVVFESYQIWGFNSAASVRIGWGTQGFVTLARAVAVVEVCHRILAKYSGIWRLAKSLLIGGAALVSLYSWAVSRGSWRFAVLNLDRGLELMMASVIVLLFAFARFYEVAVSPSVRTLAAGLFLYSAFQVLNDTMWGRWLNHYTALWSLLGTGTFLASLLLWIAAMWDPQSEATLAPELLPESHYQMLSPEINSRLRNFNEQLSRFWHVEGKKT